jgi:hypothetical protein
MSIFQGSRYIRGENGERITATRVTLGGKQITFLHDRKVFKEDDLRGDTDLYEVKPGDLVDLLAFNESGQAIKWYLIADLNEMFFPDDEMDKGRILIMPSLEDFQSL